MDDYHEPQPAFIKRLAALWSAKIKAGVTARKSFDLVYEQCKLFNYAPNGFIWDDGYKQKFKLNVPSPKMPVTINKAFELLAIVGPSIYWRYAAQSVDVVTPVDIVSGAFGDEQQPEIAQFVESLRAQQQADSARVRQAALLVQRVLETTQVAQPGGGQISQGRLAINDMLLSGRALFWPQVYVSPGSDRKGVGLFRGDPTEFVQDPDCDQPYLDGATWIGRRHCTPHWQLERMFGKPNGSCKKYATLESTDGEAKRRTGKAEWGKSHDLVVWYEIWSKCGIGFSLSTSKAFDGPDLSAEFEGIEQEIEAAVGDHAYLCLIPGHQCILNLPADIRTLELEEVADVFRWPFETWKANDRWPVAIWDHYPDGAYPVPPLGPALGHLIVISILTTAYVEMAFEGRKQIVGILDTYKKQLEEALASSENTPTVSLSATIGKKIDECIAFLPRPPINYDIIKAIDHEMELFKQASGLYDWNYANTSGIERSAEGVRAKQQASTVRADDMAERFAAFMSEASTLLAMLAWEHIDGADVLAILGAGGDMLWDQFVKGLSEDEVYRGFRVQVQASDIRKPDKARELANAEKMFPVAIPLAQMYADKTGDSGPINVLMAKMQDAMDWKGDKVEFGQFVQAPPSLEAAQQQQRAMEAEVQKTEAEANLANAKAQSEMVGAEGDVAVQAAQLEQEQVRAQMEMQRSAAEFQMDVTRSATEIDFDRQKHAMDLRATMAKNAIGLEHQIQLARIKEKQAAQKPKPQPAAKTKT